MQRLKDYIHRDRLANPKEFWIETFATPLAIGAALAVSLLQSETPWTLVYSIFVLASAAMLLTSYRRGVIMWVLLNTFYLGLNTIGLIVSII